MKRLLGDKHDLFLDHVHDQAADRKRRIIMDPKKALLTQILVTTSLLLVS